MTFFSLNLVLGWLWWSYHVIKRKPLLYSYKLLHKLEFNVRFNNMQNTENTMVLKTTVHLAVTLSPSENVIPSTALFQVISGIGSPSASHVSVTWPFSYVVSFLSCIMWGCTVKNIYITQSALEEKPCWALKSTVVRQGMLNVLAATAACLASERHQESCKQVKKFQKQFLSIIIK